MSQECKCTIANEKMVMASLKAPQIQLLASI